MRILPVDPARTWNNPKKKAVAKDMLARYSGADPDEISKHIILTNFQYYLEKFADKYKCKIKSGSALQIATSKKPDISMVCFNIGAPMSALVIEMLSSIDPSGVVMLGMCGGLHRDLKIGDLFLPMAAIRDEGTSQHYLPSQVPALPTFTIQKYLSQVVVEKGLNYFAGVVHTTDYRLWEFDPSFIEMLKQEKVGAIEMETATLFISAFACKVPCGALLLVSDLPLKEVKSSKSAKKVFSSYTEMHFDVGIEAMLGLEDNRDKVRHFTW